MRRRLGEQLDMPDWPGGVNPGHSGERHARDAHALLRLAYTGGEGQAGNFDAWWQRLTQDGEYDPALCFAVWDGDDVIGLAQCWTSAFIKDFAIHPRHRRRRVGRALALHVFHAFKRRGAGAVDLKVLAANPVGMRFYESLGMTVVPD